MMMRNSRVRVVSALCKAAAYAAKKRGAKDM